VVEAWNGVSVKNVAVEENGASLRVTVNLGQLSPEDVKVELFLGREGTELEKVRTVELRRYVSEGDSTFTYFTPMVSCDTLVTLAGSTLLESYLTLLTQT